MYRLILFFATLALFLFASLYTFLQWSGCHYIKSE